MGGDQKWGCVFFSESILMADLRAESNFSKWQVRCSTPWCHPRKEWILFQKLQIQVNQSHMLRWIWNGDLTAQTAHPKLHVQWPAWRTPSGSTLSSPCSSARRFCSSRSSCWRWNATTADPAATADKSAQEGSDSSMERDVGAVLFYIILAEETKWRHAISLIILQLYHPGSL